MLIAFHMPGPLLEHGIEILQYAKPKSALQLLLTGSCSTLWSADCVCGSLHVMTAPYVSEDSYKLLLRLPSSLFIQSVLRSHSLSEIHFSC